MDKKLTHRIATDPVLYKLFALALRRKYIMLLEANKPYFDLDKAVLTYIKLLDEIDYLIFMEQEH